MESEFIKDVAEARRKCMSKSKSRNAQVFDKTAIEFNDNVNFLF